MNSACDISEVQIGGWIKYWNWTADPDFVLNFNHKLRGMKNSLNRDQGEKFSGVVIELWIDDREKEVKFNNENERSSKYG